MAGTEDRVRSSYHGTRADLKLGDLLSLATARRSGAVRERRQ